MQTKKIRYKSLVEQVTDGMLELIETGGLKPGDRLPSTATLLVQFGVSRPVIREALKTLEGRGIIQISNGRSAVIQPVTADVLKTFFKRAVIFENDNLRDVFEVRYAIEVQSARLAAQRRSNEDVEVLNSLVCEMRRAMTDAERYTELDLEYHQRIADASGNQLITYMVHSIRDALRDMIREGLGHRLTSEERELVQTTHEDIVKEIAAMNEQGAVQAMAFHFTDAIRAIFELSMKEPAKLNHGLLPNDERSQHKMRRNE